MAGTFILKPYERRRDPGVFGRFIRIFGLIMLAAFYGLLCSVLPLQLLVVPAIPILVLVGLILWMLPDVGGIYADTMAKLLAAYAFLFVVWPWYVAIDVPGVPWVSPQRICIAALVAVFLFNLAKSSEFRQMLTDVMAASPFTRRVFWIFCGVTLVSLPFSATLGFSINKFINNQIFWTMMFVVSACLATRPGFVFRVGQLLVIGAIMVSMAGLYEAASQRVIWMDHLPGFLQVDPILMATFASAQSRAGTDIYRVRGTMGVSLYYAEYLAMVLPFVLHMIVCDKRFRNKVLLSAGAVAIAANMYLTNARSGMIGLFASLVAYTFFVAVRLRRRDSGSLVSSAMFYAYPLAVMMLGMVVLASTRLRTMTLGGGAHQASSDARKAQWEMGIPKIMDHPLGHGVGRANEALGYTNRGGGGTIDTYYLSLLMDYGPIGFVCFLLIFASVVWFGFKAYLAAATPDQDMAAPLAVGLLNFLVIKSVLSAELNIPIAFMMTGFVVGLMYQQQRAGLVPPPATKPILPRLFSRFRASPQAA
ncbi:O-antigen ligase family protein [Sandarakinorhabdus sp. DWP1-3-1]|uniref:O-antigen ligase family protein n=1 Tax=Sandarakinorhabdus sp. DWP1-3-1 TaxID=2804627 RepID=UPI003CF0BC82